MKNRTIIIGANNFQLWPIYEDFKRNGQVVLINMDSDVKEQNGSQGVFLSVCHAIELGHRASSSFSYRHMARYFSLRFILNIKKLVLFLITYWSIRDSRVKSWFLPKLLRCLRLIYSTRDIDVQRGDTVVFCSLMQSDLEYKYFIKANLNNAKTIYYPGNWDNPSSKLTMPFGTFDLGFCWTDEMMQLMQRTNYFKDIIYRPHYRLNYIQGYNFSKECANHVLLALSQKSGSGLKELLDQLAIKLKDYPWLNIIVRLHPYNSNILLDYKETQQLRIDRPNSGDINGCSFDESEKEYREYVAHYQKLVTQSSVIVTEGGTIGLEGLNIGKPVIILSTERRNRTALLSNHFDHYRLLTSSENCIALFDDAYLVDKLVRMSTLEPAEPLPELRIRFI